MSFANASRLSASGSRSPAATPCIKGTRQCHAARFGRWIIRGPISAEELIEHTAE